MSTCLRLTAFVAVTCLVLCSLQPVSAFYANGRWGFTVNDGPTGLPGDPATVTWSIVPDGTPIPFEPPSNLISFLDTQIGAGPGGSDLSLRPWFSLVEDSFNRWTELSGLTFVYDPIDNGALPADDGAQLNNNGGVLGTRGEVRLGGTFLDGNGGTSAMAGFLPDADITMDTGDVVFYGNPSNNYQNFRNTLMHEIGHSLGLGHIDSFAAILMEPFYTNLIDGPQIDDIRGAHNRYGDVLERGPAGRNDSWQTATDLGTLSDGQSIALGTDADSSMFVFPGETDFVSISNLNDDDFFAFTVIEPSQLDVLLTPVGPTYLERITGSGPQYTTTNSASLNDLRFDIFGPSSGGGDPPLLASVSTTGLGEVETLNDLVLPESGEYFVHVHGSTNLVQLYQLELAVESIGLPGDFDSNGFVDAQDFLLWQRDTSIGDLADWQNAYSAFLANARTVTPATDVLPEPSSLAVLFCAALSLVMRNNRSL